MADCAEEFGRRTAGADFEALKAAFRTLAQALERIAETEVSDRARDEVRKLLSEVDALVERLGDVKVVASAGRSRLEHAIRAQPLGAVGLAAAAGFLAAAVLRRRPS